MRPVRVVLSVYLYKNINLSFSIKKIIGYYDTSTALTSPAYHKTANQGAYYAILTPKFSTLAAFAPTLAASSRRSNNDFALVTTTAAPNTPTRCVDTNATFIAYVLGTLLPASYARTSVSVRPVPMLIDFGCSYTYYSSLPAERVTYLVRNCNDPTLAAITIILEEEDKEEDITE
ncbi:hypothetical protein MYCTH_93007 [Thermothelomyces thermophilus ATCC 42464]|uniref:Uncharacterized protein n=1 Tax=Thermothelomyces thermophilus (strain ATCC 42464 / BCRC 31852 / DSM 1799) TaxID=573729 RepID=G2Q8T7_THET4|nr:uncharacterized protein MYCTH_93007 [Thermothelomyces thermophilus ATCC 42464]AEO56282.1 hypothetical protein MYCTH_93007 [Thermothelomyces thermophilus ATCC 42464]